MREQRAARAGCWLVWCWRGGETKVTEVESSREGRGLSPGGVLLEMLAQFRKPSHNQQPLPRWRRIHFLMLQNPGVAVGHENCVQSRGQRGIDVRPGAVADHPGGIAHERMFSDHGLIG